MLACIFAPREAVAPPVLPRWSNTLADGLRRWCTPRAVRVRHLP